MLKIISFLFEIAGDLPERLNLSAATARVGKIIFFASFIFSVVKLM